MAGRRKEQLAPSNSLVASAVTYSGVGKVESVYRPMERWQTEAWDFYDNTPELRFAAGWMANAVSRCLLAPGVLGDKGKVEATNDTAITAALNAIFGNSEGQAEMLHSLALHLTVAGECYLVGRKVPTGVRSPDGKFWEVVGVREITTGGGGSWTIKSSIDNRNITLGVDDTVIRVYRQHPAFRYQADSPVRALLPVLTEIKYLTLHIFAQARSRLAGAGVQVLPNNVEFPGMDPDKNRAEQVMEVLGTAMATAIKDPGNPAALIPITLLVPPEAVKDIKEPLHYWSPFDEKASEARSAAIARFATGFDLPPEVISGMSAGLSSSGGRGTGLSHWGQWQIEESAIKMHIEPLLEIIGNAIILGFIRPTTGNPRAALLYDTNALKLQPDRSKEALEAYDRGELNGEGIRFYNGLSEDYLPSDDERRFFILKKIATGAATPDMVAEAARMLGVNFSPTAGQGPPAPETQQPRTLDDHPSRSTPDTEAAMMQLSCLAEPLVLRALERAGNRLRNQGIKPPDVEAQDVYMFASINGNAAELLEGAWCHVPKVADGICDPESLTKVLQSYTEGLLQSQSPHTRQALRSYLNLVKA